MLPQATATRSTRESIEEKLGGRTQEISHLISRSLRTEMDYTALGENTIRVDRDVLRADSDTRTAAITGAWITLHHVIGEGKTSGFTSGEPLKDSVCAISVGVVDGEARLDLPYEEDVRVETDMSMVMTETGKLIGAQGTVEDEPFSREDLSRLLDLAQEGCVGLVRVQSVATRAAKGAILTLIDGVLT